MPARPVFQRVFLWDARGQRGGSLGKFPLCVPQWHQKALERGCGSSLSLGTAPDSSGTAPQDVSPVDALSVSAVPLHRPVPS